MHQLKTQPGLARALEKNVAAGRLSFICGAGVSTIAPTRLPLARALVASALRPLAGSYYRRLRAMQLRPEIVFGLVADVYGRRRTIALLRHLLSEARHNVAHSILASAIADGTPVVTTNFDTCIEGAASVARRKIRVLRCGAPGARTASAALFKIHGFIDDWKSIRTTMDDVYRGLSSLDRSRLRSAVSRRTVVVLGYSGLDQLDVMAELANANYKNIVWIVHRPRERRVRSVSPPNRWAAALPRCTVLSTDTERFVRCWAQLRHENTQSPNEFASVADHESEVRQRSR